MTTISWLDILWCLIPIILVCGVYIAWQGKPSDIIIAVLRMAMVLGAAGIGAATMLWLLTRNKKTVAVN